MCDLILTTSVFCLYGLKEDNKQKSKKRKKKFFFIFSMSRPNIGLSTVHRLLDNSTGSHKVSKAAAELVVESVTSYLEKAGEAAAEHLKIAKRKTVTADVAKKVLANKCLGISDRDLMYIKGTTRGLPVAGTLRVFSQEGKSGKKKSSGLGFNTSEDAKKVIAAAAEAYIKYVGVQALRLAEIQDVNRKTIKERDIRAVLVGIPDN